MNSSIEEQEKKNAEIAEKEKKLQEVTSQYDKLKTLLDQKGYARTRRENTSTTLETITNADSSTRYRRRKETKNVLEYIHGGEQGALLGAWDFVAANMKKEMMDNLIGKYKRGKYLEGIVGEAMKEFNKSTSSMAQAVAFKYQNFLSRRKFNFMCKTQSSVFDPNDEVWVPRNIKCLGIDMQLSLNYISNEKVDKFVKSLDIGSVIQVPNVPGVTRTVTGLVFMIIDLHLRLPHLCRQLVWFNGNTNHFVFQFSDDGAPETSQLTMSVGSITLWNLGERVRSREFQYLLHCVSLGEKHEVLELLWRQHTEEMLLLESSVFTICGRECTLQFQPSADMSWQSWACNEVNQAATYPSPYANVHKGNLCTMNGRIGSDDSSTWKPYNSEIREKHLGMVSAFVNSLPKSHDEKALHARKLAFMAENGIRQLGKPRIGIFADRVRPDPLHCEVNAWQHILDLLYSESVRRNRFEKFIEILSAPVGVEAVDHEYADVVDNTSNLHDCISSELANDQSLTDANDESLTDANDESLTDANNFTANSLDPTAEEEGTEQNVMLLNLQRELAAVKMSNTLSNSAAIPSSAQSIFGCGLAYLRTKIQEHYDDESKRFNKLGIRIIGQQAIALARNSFRLVDCLKTVEETEGEKLKRLALSKIVENLRNASGLFNKIHIVSQGEIDELEDFCQLYFNLLVLFFPESVNVTVWTVAYAIPFHARKLYEEYGIGFGILSLQAKESKHAGLKAELSLTNRSQDSSSSGKWWQVMRASYIRSFYLPEHQPSPASYSSHFKSRKPPHCELLDFCDCGRKKDAIWFYPMFYLPSMCMCCRVCTTTKAVRGGNCHI